MRSEVTSPAAGGMITARKGQIPRKGNARMGETERSPASSLSTDCSPRSAVGAQYIWEVGTGGCWGVGDPTLTTDGGWPKGEGGTPLTTDGFWPESGEGEGAPPPLPEIPRTKIGRQGGCLKTLPSLTTVHGQYFG